MTQISWFARAIALMPWAGDDENPARNAHKHAVRWRFALRYEVPELLLALYVRDVLKLKTTSGPALPRLDPPVESRPSLVTAPARVRIQTQWNGWWEELVSKPQPAVDLPMDLSSLPSLRSRPDLAEITAAVSDESMIWISERVRESAFLREQGAIVDGGHGELFAGIFSRILLVEPQHFNFAVTELSVAGDAVIELSTTHFVVTREFACHIDDFESWLRKLLEERAESLHA